MSRTRQSQKQRGLSKRARRIAAYQRAILKEKLFWIGLSVFLFLIWLPSAWMQVSQWWELYCKLKDNPEIVTVTDSGLALMFLLPWFGFWFFRLLTREASISDCASNSKPGLLQSIRGYFIIFLVLAAPALIVVEVPTMVLNAMAPNPYIECGSKRFGVGKGAYRITTYALSSQSCGNLEPYPNQK